MRDDTILYRDNMVAVHALNFLLLLGIRHSPHYYQPRKDVKYFAGSQLGIQRPS